MDDHLRLIRPLVAISLLFMLFSVQALAQNQTRIDSLLHQLKTAKGKDEIRTLILLGFEFREVAPQKTLEYAEKAINLAQKANDKKHLAWAIRLKGKAYKYQHEYNEALRFFLQSLALEEGLKNTKGTAECFKELGDAYKGRSDFGQAFKYYKKALEIFEKIDDKRGSMVVLNNMADAYQATSQFRNSVSLATKAMEIAVELNDEKEVNRATLILSKAYADLENYENAYKFFLLHTEVKDSLAKREKTSEINALERKFEEERRREQAEKEAKEERNYRNNIQYLSIFIFFGLLFGGLFFLPQIGIPNKVISTLIFLSLFLGVQFMLLLLSPWTEKYTGGNPIPRLAMNAFFAYLLLRINRYFDRQIKEKVFEDDPEMLAELDLLPDDDEDNNKEKTGKDTDLQTSEENSPNTTSQAEIDKENTSTEVNNISITAVTPELKR